jgi:hypothetical protein
MGYNTDFKGTLKFTSELTAKQIRELQRFCGEDVRDHEEWWIDGDDPDLTYICLELTDDYEGLEWDGSEKTYDMVEKINLILQIMREKWPDFGLVGSMEAQGEEMDDRWRLVCPGGLHYAYREDVALTGRIVKCPHCEEQFRLEED